jgi:hypothetical protein
MLRRGMPVFGLALAILLIAGVALRIVTVHAAAPSFNNEGISNDSSPAAANFDGGGKSYSNQALTAAGFASGASVMVNGVSFQWPSVASGASDNWQVAGQQISFASGLTSVAFLGSSTNGPSSGTGTLGFNDGTSQPFTLGLSDWTLNAGTASPLAGTSIAVKTTYRNTPTGPQTNHSTYVFYSAFAAPSGKTVTSVTLPTTVNQGVLHVFAVSGTGASAPPSNDFNNEGVSDDSNTKAANFDGGGYSYSNQALSGAGLASGASVAINGASFQWPTIAAGTKDNWQTANQDIALSATNANTLAFLGSATNGPSSGTATIHFGDGSSQTFTLGFSDWTLNGGKSQALAGTGVAAQMSYRNGASGKQSISTYVFFTSVPLPTDKTATSVTLPASVSQGHLHVFAVSAASLTPTPTPTPGPGQPTVTMGQTQLSAPVANTTPDALTAETLQALAVIRDWRKGIAQSGQPTNLAMPTSASWKIGGTQTGVITDPTRTQIDGLNGANSGDVEPANVAFCLGGVTGVEMAGGKVAYYTVSGTAPTRSIQSTGTSIPLTQFFNEPAELTDNGHTYSTVVLAPRCTYDTETSSWWATAQVLWVDQTTSPVTFYQHSRFDLAVSPSGPVQSAWSVYRVDTTNDGTNGTPNASGCPCIGDEPLLGFDKMGVYVDTNEFTFGNDFHSAHIYAFDKAALRNKAATVNFAQFGNLRIGGAPAASIQPSIQYGYPNAEFFLNSLDPLGTVDNRLGLWAMTSEGNVGLGQAPKLTSMVVTTQRYGLPPASVPQKGTTDTVYATDDRMQQVEYRQSLNELSGVVSTSVIPSGDSNVRTGIAWFVLKPSVGSGGLTGASVLRQGSIGVAKEHLLAPSLNLVWDEDMQVAATLVGPDYYPTVAYTTTHPRANSPFGPLQLAGNGARAEHGYTCNQPVAGAPCHWGHYSAAAWDPTTINAEGLSWMAIPYEPNGPSDANVNWGTRLFGVGPI